MTNAQKELLEAAEDLCRSSLSQDKWDRLRDAIEAVKAEAKKDAGDERLMCDVLYGGKEGN